MPGPQPCGWCGRDVTDVTWAVAAGIAGSLAGSGLTSSAMLTRGEVGRVSPMRSCCQPTTRPICRIVFTRRDAAEDVVTASTKEPRRPNCGSVRRATEAAMPMAALSRRLASLHSCGCVVKTTASTALTCAHPALTGGGYSRAMDGRLCTGAHWVPREY